MLNYFTAIINFLFSFHKSLGAQQKFDLRINGVNGNQICGLFLDVNNIHCSFHFLVFVFVIVLLAGCA